MKHTLDLPTEIVEQIVTGMVRGTLNGKNPEIIKTLRPDEHFSRGGWCTEAMEAFYETNVRKLQEGNKWRGGLCRMPLSGIRFDVYRLTPTG